MPKTTIFLGSSTAAKSQAKALIKELSSATLEFLPWWEAFTPGKLLLEELDNIRDNVDGAMLLFSPESETKIKGQKKSIPNLNVVFEFGYFYGHFGKQKVVIIKYGEFFLPSDFGGYTWIQGSTFFKRAQVTKIGNKTKVQFEKWIQKL